MLLLHETNDKPTTLEYIERIDTERDACEGHFLGAHSECCVACAALRVLCCVLRVACGVLRVLPKPSGVPFVCSRVFPKR
jgi:hypothetical protein